MGGKIEKRGGILGGSVPSPYFCPMKDNEKGRDNRPVPRMHQRSIHHSYHGRGIYLVTLCTEGRLPLLGALKGTSPADAHVEPSALGMEVIRCWEAIPAIQRQLAAQKAARTGEACHRSISLIASQLMPDHFHGIIFVHEEMDIALGDVIRGFMVGCSRAFNGRRPQGGGWGISPQICGAPDQGKMEQAPDQGKMEQGAYREAVRWSANSRGEDGEDGDDASGGSHWRPLWEKGYHDRLLKHEGQLQNMIDYVRDNPRRLFIKRSNPAFFAVQRAVKFRHWSFSSVGNLRLLDAPLKAVHVRRYFSTEQRRDYMNGCIIEARRGSVLIGAFISEHEKRVLNEALREGLCCILLCPYAFPDFFKPSGELLPHCSTGRLLFLALSEAPQQQERSITRAECSSLNAIAESMAREL